MPRIAATTDPFAARLAKIYDPIIEDAVRAAYARDYQAFGFVFQTDIPRVGSTNTRAGPVSISITST